MNKKFISVILLSALMVGAAGTCVACKDYDDDIENLQKQIDENAKAIDPVSYTHLELFMAVRRFSSQSFYG